jgi:hypothetical protein
MYDRMSSGDTKSCVARTDRSQIPKSTSRSAGTALRVFIVSSKDRPIAGGPLEFLSD